MSDTLNTDSSMDALFAALKDSSSKPQTHNPSDEPSALLEENDNKVLFEEENSGKDTEKIFRDIEVRLQHLPKLSTQFDGLTASRTAPPTSKSLLVKTKEAQREAAQDDWFTLPKPSDSKRKQLERDLTLIKHRAALDPKRHYKKQKWVAPERFSVGTIVEGKDEFFSSRINKRERKQTIMESLMGDDTSNKYFKRKFTEIQDQKSSGRRGHYNKNKAMRKRY